MVILGNMLLSLVGRYGYLAEFFGVALESTGVPVPGDALFFGILGAATGDQTGSWVERKGGRPFVLRWVCSIRGPSGRSS